MECEKKQKLIEQFVDVLNEVRDNRDYIVNQVVIRGLLESLYSEATKEISYPSDDEMRSVFLNMDRALKYIHEHDYCIEIFHPSYIDVLNNSDDYIQFNQLLKMPLDNNISRKIIQEDIFRSSFIQIGIY